MPKKSTGFVAKGGQTNPTEKAAVPFKTPSMKPDKLPTAIDGGANKVAAMPNTTRFPKLTRPAKFDVKPPRI